VTTRARVGIVLGVALSLWVSTAFASDWFRYRDFATGCDLVVDRADQIPRPSRDGARLLRAGEHEVARGSAAACLQRAAVRFGAGGTTGTSPGPRAIEANLSYDGGRYLTRAEIADLKRLCSPRVSAFVLAALAALAAWIAVMVAAFREDHLGWAMLMLFFSAPMAFIYLFTTLGKGRGRFKTVCALGMLSPLLVFVANVWLAFGATHG